MNKDYLNLTFNRKQTQIHVLSWSAKKLFFNKIVILGRKKQQWSKAIALMLAYTEFVLGKKIFIVSKQKNRQKIQKIDIYNIHKLYTK